MKIVLAFVSVLIGLSSGAIANGGCRSELAKRIRVEGRPLTQADIDPFLQVYDLYPERMQKFMCGFKQFKIVPMRYSAFSDMSIRSGLFEKQRSANHRASWKDQLNFGIPNDDNFNVSADLPLVHIQVNGIEPSFL